LKLPLNRKDELVKLAAEDALTHARFAERYSSLGLPREGAEKAFNAWRFALGALALKCLGEELERMKKLPEALLLGIPSRMLSIAAMIEERCYEGVLMGTARAMRLYDYYRHGADPSGWLSPIRNDDEALEEMKKLIEDIKKVFEEAGI
jgi:hypothetical protein